MTTGARTARWWPSRVGRRFRVTAPKVDVVDTTGAGDAFAGALAVRLAAGDGRRRSLPRYAVAAAALSVSHAGARAGMPRAGAVEAAQRGA